MNLFAQFKIILSNTGIPCKEYNLLKLDERNKLSVEGRS